MGCPLIITFKNTCLGHGLRSRGLAAWPGSAYMSLEPSKAVLQGPAWPGLVGLGLAGLMALSWAWHITSP
ncbi:hypothetical protein PHLCEN_2v2577 [Hermanssonia centrifuga]|uniref:Uncharacterized protein n=1 Tax=Hermanssonia centrifuga TaxID=98765 RepID=A0A2R6RLI5_9APHY|nr:hypothetical protein PHLCEN_2v2577 [Hermanssonia centrifuga]